MEGASACGLVEWGYGLEPVRGHRHNGVVPCRLCRQVSAAPDGNRGRGGCLLGNTPERPSWPREAMGSGRVGRWCCSGVIRIEIVVDGGLVLRQAATGASDGEGLKGDLCWIEFPRSF
jgi:hypothetical protein